MKPRLINVRLDEEHLRKVRRLRREGVVLSDLVREAIDARFEALIRPRRSGDVEQMMRRLFEQHPDPVDLPPREYDVHDASAARAAIRRKVTRRRQ